MQLKFLNKRIISKYIFILTAIIIAISFLVISNQIANDLAKEERLKIQLWAHALQNVADEQDGAGAGYNLALEILAANKSIPVILCDDANNFITFVNIDVEADTVAVMKSKIEAFGKEKEPIVLENANFKQHVYYGDSSTLTRLQYFPYIQICVLSIFIMISFMAMLSTKKAEQNKLFVGFSKEAAHQLGTPISSILAWVEYLKGRSVDASIINEMEKDVQRLQIITERFSKIGSKTPPQLLELQEEVKRSVSYLNNRISKKVAFNFDFPQDAVYVPIVPSLFSWVIENLTKNAVDAMQGQGSILFSITTKGNKVYLDITDTGSGMPKSKFEEIFRPGYTTKERGWGLGLSLVKRIVDDYHKGSIQVKSSEINVGTTFRIELDTNK